MKEFGLKMHRGYEQGLLTGLMRLAQALFRLYAGRGGIYYMGGGQVLPPALSSEEEARVLERLAQGDKSAQTELIERNLRLVVYIARKFENTGIELEDLISIGTIGLIKAVETFRVDKNIKLATYASRCIENEILMYIRKIGNRRGEVSLEEPLHTDWDGNELHLADILGSDEDSIYRELESDEDRKTVAAAIQTLSPRDRKIISLRFGLGGGPPLTQKEVADLLGISQSYISRIEKKNMVKLRKEIETKV